MAEINGDLIYEMLKRIQSDTFSVKFDIAGLKTEVSNLRGTMVSIQMDIHLCINGLIAAIKGSTGLRQGSSFMNFRSKHSPLSILPTDDKCNNLRP